MEEGLTGLSLQAALGHAGQLEFLLNEPGATPNVVDRDGDRTPLHWAAARGHLKCVHLLLHAGVYTSATDAQGRSAEQLALQCGRECHGHPTCTVPHVSFFASFNQPTRMFESRRSQSTRRSS